MKIDRNSVRTFILILLTNGLIWSAVLHAREFRGGYDPTWATEPLFDSNINRGIAATSIGSDNLPQIVGMVNSRRYSGVGLEYFREIGNVWNQEIIESGLPVETIPSILDDSNPQAIGLSPTNDPRIAYIVPGIGLKFAWKNGAGNWNISTVDPLAQLFVSMKVDSSGKVHLAYFAPEKLKYGIWNGVSWSTTTVDSGGVGKFNSLALDRSNSIYISYYDHVNKDLKMASWNGINWSTQTVYSEGEAGKYSSIAINSFNNPCIAHLKEREIYYSRWNGSSWDHEGIGSYGTEMSLAFNSFGKPEIAFNLSNSLSYVALVDTVWREWRINESQGDNPSLGFGTDGSKHIVCGWKSIFHLTSEYFEYPTQTNLFSRTPNTITWKWNDNSTKETGFVILEASNLTPISPELPANTTYWTQLGLTPNSPSEIIVRAFNPKTFVDSQISPRYWTSAEIPTIRDVVKTGDNSAEVYFLSNGNSRSTLYYVEYSSDSINYTLVGPSGYPDRPYPFFNLKDGNSYNFRIRASNDENLFSPYSYFDTPLVLPNTSPPSAPTNLRIINRTTTTLTWAWDDTSLNETGFRIIRDMEIHEELTSNTSNWTQGGLTPNKMERIQVLAYNDKGQTLSQRFYLPTEEYTLAAKPGLSVGAVGATTVELVIDPKGNPAGTEYVVEKEKSDGSSFEMLFTTTSLTPVVTGLESGTHRFRLKAQNHGGNLTETTDPTEGITVTGPELPPHPPVHNGFVFVSERSLRTNWDASPGATGYTLGVSLSEANPPVLLKFVDTTELAGEVTGLELNTTYYVFLKASNPVGSSDWILADNVVTYAEKPGLSVGTVGATTVELIIDPKGNPAGTEYSVEYKQDDGDYSLKLTTTALSFAVERLTRGSNFSFRVRAVNHANQPTDFAFSEPVQLAPDKPVRAKLESVGVDGSEVSWVSSVGAKSYNVLASKFEDDPLKDAKRFSTELSSITLTGLNPNTTYYLSVQSVNEGGVSDYLSIGRMVTLAAAPGLSLDLSGINSIRIIIEPNGNPLGTVYQVEGRSENDGFVKKISTTSLLLTIEGLESGTVYQFQVRAINHGGIATDYSPIRNGETVMPAITTVAEARAYPVPFRPGSGHSSMTIDQIPMGSTIRVYTMSGSLVKELRAETESVQWDVKNDGGEDASSGVYIVRVSGSGGNKTFKIMVQR